jgi:hypothetical protein
LGGGRRRKFYVYLTSKGRVVFDKLIIAQLVKIFLPLIEAKIAVPYSQEPNT